MENESHIQAIGDLIERKKSLEIEANRLINRKKEKSVDCKFDMNNCQHKNSQHCKNSKKNKSNELSNNFKSSYRKNSFHQPNTRTSKNKDSTTIFIDDKMTKSSRALKTERNLAKFTIQQVLSSFPDDSPDITKNNTLLQRTQGIWMENMNKSYSRKKVKIIKKTPQQIYDDLNRQSHSIKIRKYKDPRLVPEAIHLPQSDIETLEHAEVQTPISFKLGGLLNSKFEFYRTFMNSKMKKKFFNWWFSKWSRLEIKKLRNDLRVAIVNAKDNIEEKKKYMRDYEFDDSLYSNIKKYDDEEKGKQDTPVNMDLYNENFLKEDIFINPQEEKDKKIEPLVDFYIGGE